MQQIKPTMIRLTRGTEQRRWLNNMLTGEQCSPARELRGKASRYASRYKTSFDHLLSRMRTAGYEITRTPGKLGGEWGAVYAARP